MFGRAWAVLSFLPLMISGVTATAAQVRTDIEYARVNGVSLRMDASIPDGNGNFPAVIIVHGGGWVSGDRKTNVQPLFEPLSESGIAWFSISYRLVTDITQFGVGISDVEQAVRFVKTHAAQFRIDPDKIALIGESAGGQLAAMAALQPDTKDSVKAVVALYAPTDLVALAKTSNYVPASIRDSVKGTPWEGLVLAGLGQLSPINNVRRDMPPFLLIHGTADSLVPFDQSKAMCERMKAAGASCEVYPVRGAGHGIRWWESAGLGTGYKTKITTWLHQEFEAGRRPLQTAVRRASASSR